MATKLTDLAEENRLLVDRYSALKSENAELLNAKQQADTLTGQVSALTQENHRLESEKTRLQERIDELAQYPSLASLRPHLVHVLLSGFLRGKPHLGTWEIVNGVAYQKDPAQYFGELLLPVRQLSQPTLFSFTGRATGKDWVGFGLHIFVSNNPGKKGYGLGDSLLVWITRDEKVYEDNFTYIQLYRSYNAVNMERVLDARIEEPISEYVKVDVLYDPTKEYIAISINGTEKIRYQTWFGIDSGLEVALRTLKEGVSFKDLLVLTTN